MLNKIQGGRWDEYLRRLFPIKERSIAPTIAPELVGQIMVQEFEDELLFLRDERLYWGFSDATQVAGQFSFGQLINVSTNKLVIVESCRAEANQVIEVRLGNIALGNPATVGGLDTRNGLTLAAGRTAAELRFGTSAGISGTQVCRLEHQNLLSYEILPRGRTCILAPGHGLIIWNVTIQNDLSCNWAWRERLATPAELANQVVT